MQTHHKQHNINNTLSKLKTNFFINDTLSSLKNESLTLLLQQKNNIHIYEIYLFVYLSIYYTYIYRERNHGEKKYFYFIHCIKYNELIKT